MNRLLQITYDRIMENRLYQGEFVVIGLYGEIVSHSKPTLQLLEDLFGKESLQRKRLLEVGHTPFYIPAMERC